MGIIENYLILLGVLATIFTACLGGYTFRGCLGLTGSCILPFEVIIITDLELWAHINSFGLSPIPHVLQAQAH
jgi:hypothetical protein